MWAHNFSLLLKLLSLKCYDGRIHYSRKKNCFHGNDFSHYILVVLFILSHVTWGETLKKSVSGNLFPFSIKILFFLIYRNG